MRALHATTLALALTASACAPLPTTRYVPVADERNIVYSSCSFNSHVPLGVRLPVGAASATIKAVAHEGRHYLDLRLDVPPGTALQFDGDAAQLTTQGATRALRLPAMRLVDAPVWQTQDDAPLLRDAFVPIQTAMPGGEVGPPTMRSPRHYWVAVPLGSSPGSEFEVALPPLVENGQQAHRLLARFRSQAVVVVALMNC
jgi:hypothetical protein